MRICILKIKKKLFIMLIFSYEIEQKAEVTIKKQLNFFFLPSEQSIFFSLVYIVLLIKWHLCTTMIITLQLFYNWSNTKGNGTLLDKNNLTRKPSKQTCLCSQIYSQMRYVHEIFLISKHSVWYFCEVLIPVKKSAIWLGNML